MDHSARDEVMKKIDNHQRHEAACARCRGRLNPCDEGRRMKDETLALLLAAAKKDGLDPDKVMAHFMGLRDRKNSSN